MRLTVFSHKLCWPCQNSPTGYATDGGFPFQMAALAELFDETRLVVPVRPEASVQGEIPLGGHRMSVVALTPRTGRDILSKLSFLPWLFANRQVIWRELTAADAVHAPIPGDVGTVGMIGAWLLRKPLFVRHCCNWLAPVTMAEKLWRWFMETTAGGRNVMLATGGTSEGPLKKNSNLHWIFSSSLTAQELEHYAQRRAIRSDGEMRLIIVARQEKAKGAGVVIRSLPFLAGRFRKVSFEIIGEGTAISEFKQLALDTGVSDRVVFAGRLNHEQVMQRLREADLFVFPTTSSDGFPKAVLEGLASGLPVVATRVSVLPQLLGNGCGVLVEDPTPESVARGIEQALSDPIRYEAMSGKAIETVRQYSLEAWRDTIGGYLTNAWEPLAKSESRKQK